ncbi:MAG: DNA mismatch repair endonuclease MutL [Prevotella sp.]|nr:DNA mismatch repair endonuclease MutL [Prevotella sp.]
MDIIQLLPDSVANQIAAGEVIQRPASVIKELVENAIDAGAHNIQVLIVDAGKTSVQVIDDGCGMSDTDARLSFERHATSKIRQATDLFSLRTMGFRGEALASIAAVAQVTLQTRARDEEVGTRLVISGSRFEGQEVVSCPVGSNFLIENLFFNVPARRKFLKSNSTEMSNIVQALERIVLVYPDINFTLYNNGMEVHRYQAGTLKQRIIDVFGKRIGKDLLPIEATTSLCHISGFVGSPQSARKKGNNQFFFVNGRYMKHPYFHKAVLTAFDRLLPEGEQVSYFIYFDVNPEEIDVNIHPVKTEIKFQNEQSIWQILMAAVRDAVGNFSDVDMLDFDTEGKPDIPVFNPDENRDIPAPRISFNPEYNPFTATDDKAGRSSSAAVASGSGAQKVPQAASFADFTRSRQQSSAPKGWETLFDKPATEEAKPLAVFPIQLAGQYIVCETQKGLMLIDQNRASQRILYEQYMKSLTEHSAHTQKVLFPEVVQFPPATHALLDTVIPELTSLGFELTNLGGGSYSVEGTPAGLGGMDAAALVSDLVQTAMDSGINVTEELHSILATKLSEEAASPIGVIMSGEEIENMVKQLFQCSVTRYTPSGKPIIALITNDEIARKF